MEGFSVYLRGMTWAIAALMVLGGLGSIRVAQPAQAAEPTVDDPVPDAAQFSENAAFYPPGQKAARFNDIVQLKLRAWETSAGGLPTGPSGLTGVYYWGSQLEGTGGGVWTDMRDYGRHNDAAANDSYWATDAIRVSTMLKCEFLAVPTFLDSTTGGGRPAAPPPAAATGNDHVTSVTVAIDNLAPTINQVSVVYPPEQTALKTGDKFRVVVNATDDPSADPACPKSKGARPFGVDRAVVDLRAVDGRISEGTYDDGMHGDGSIGDNTFGTLEQTLLSQNPSAELNIPVTAFDIANNGTTTGGGAIPKIRVDNTPPTVTNPGVTYAAGARAKDGDKIKVTATVGDTGAVNGIYRAYVDASSIGGDPMTPLASGTTGDIIVATGGKTGKFKLRVIAVDLAGNMAEQSVDILVQNGDTKVTISGLQANEIIQGTYKFRAVTLMAVRANISIQPGNIQGMMAFNVTNGTWEFGVNTIPLADTGTYTVQVDAFGPFDGAQAGATDTETFRVDNNAPSVDVVDPKGNDFVSGKSFSWTTGPPKNGKVNIDDAHIKLKQYAVGKEPVGWVDIATAWDTTTIGDGPVSVWFRGVDEAAHESIQTLTLIVDNNGPRGEPVTNPPSSLPVKQTTRFAFQVTDLVKVHTVDFEIKDEGGNTKFSVRLAPRMDAPSIYEIDVDTKAVLADGQHSYQATARDTAWEFADLTNEKNAVVKADHEVLIPGTAGVFHVDNSAPVANWEDRTGDGVDDKGFDHTADQTGLFTMSWLVVDSPHSGTPPQATGSAAGIESVHIRLDGGAEWVKLSGVDDVYSYPWNSGKRDNGLHSIDMKVVDKLGHESTFQFSIAIDNPDNTILWAFILPVLLFVVLIVGLMMFHRAKAKTIRETPPPMQPAAGGGA